MTRRLLRSKGRKFSGLVFSRKLRSQRKQMGGGVLYRELPKHVNGAVDVKPLEWQV
jgi:hypothetical protein